ncbi:hypothetical protein M565_ctg5P1513 [Vibrio cyclitrophicus FF75]|nr:hypothetical protein M565_ctg5P1513 [Vibrio cyclitrophicus FF75]
MFSEILDSQKYQYMVVLCDINIMSALPSPSTTTLLELETAFDTPAGIVA